MQCPRGSHLFPTLAHRIPRRTQEFLSSAPFYNFLFSLALWEKTMPTLRASSHRGGKQPREDGDVAGSTSRDPCLLTLHPGPRFMVYCGDNHEAHSSPPQHAGLLPSPDSGVGCQGADALPCRQTLVPHSAPRSSLHPTGWLLYSWQY